MIWYLKLWEWFKHHPKNSSWEWQIWIGVCDVGGTGDMDEVVDMDWGGGGGCWWGWGIYGIYYTLYQMWITIQLQENLFLRSYQLFTFSIFLNIYSNHHDCCRYSKEVHLIGRGTFIINVILFLIDGFMFLIGSKTWHNPLIWLLFYFDNSYVTIKVTYLKWIWSLISRLIFFFYLRFLSQPFTNHRTARKGVAFLWLLQLDSVN